MSVRGLSERPGGVIGKKPTAGSGIWTLESIRTYAPLTIPGLQLWLDASDASTLYDATTGGSLVAADGTVKRWEDKSGNNRHATEATNGPQRKTKIQNGLDVLRFDGTNDSLTSTDFLDLSTGQAITAFVAMKRSATGATHSVLSKFNRPFGGPDSSEDGWDFRFLSTDKLDIAFVKDASVAQRTSNSSVSASNYSVLAFKATSGSLTTDTVLYKNGEVVASSSSGSVETLDDTSYNLLIGRLQFQNSNFNFLDGDIAEIIIYGSALPDASRKVVEDYLMAKWAIS